MTLPANQHDKILDGLTTVVLLLDANLQIRYLNPAAEQFFAASASLLYSAPIERLLPNPKIRTDLQNALKTQRGFTLRETQINLPGKPKSVTADYTVTPINEPLNQALLIEIRKLDRLLRISQDNNRVNAQEVTQAVIRGLAHEVKNPLGGIRGAAQLLERELDSKALQDYTQVIIEEADRLRNLLNRMLGSNTLPAMQHINVHEVTERVRSIIDAESKHTLTLVSDYDPSLPEVYGDKDQLIQCVLNIARNAMQALTENASTSKPTIRFGTRALRQFTIGSKCHRLCLQLTIEDNGPGIPAAIKETLFYPLVSGRAHGTGLGLSIAQNIARQHNGLIECESAPGHTRFQIILPYVSTQIEHTH